MEKDIQKNLEELSKRLHKVADALADEHNNVATLEILCSTLDDAKGVIEACIFLAQLRAGIKGIMN